MIEIKLKPKPEHLVLAVQDAVRLDRAVPFIVTGCILAVLVNVLYAAIATAAFAYVNALWFRATVIGLVSDPDDK